MDSRFDELTCLYSPATQRMHAGQSYKLVLATLVATLSKRTYLVRRRDGHWMQVSDATRAAQKLLDEWCGVSLELPSGGEWQVETEKVRKFIAGDRKSNPVKLPELPVIDGTLMVPVTNALAINFEGRILLNTWRNTILKGDANALNDADVRHWVTLILRMIREGLAAQDDALDLETMVAKLHARDEAEIVFRFIMSWWAAQVQQPGINLMTNLVHVGFNQGVGKGTMSSLMGRVMGSSLVLTANADEFARGWSDQMLNRLTVCINEIGPNNKKGKGTDWYAFAKEYSQEDKITPAARYNGIGDGAIPNFTNWVFTSNDERPFRLDPDDRRMAMFPTTDNKDKNLIAQQLAPFLHGDNLPLVNQVLQGFAFILHSLQTEHELIRRPIENALREELQSANTDDLLWWLLDDQTYDRDIEQRPGYFTQKYNQYLGNHQDKYMEPKTMSSRLQGLMRHGEILGRVILRGMGPNGKPRKQWMFTVPSERFPYDDEPNASKQKQREQRMRELRALPGASETQH